jgi:hypothetical protein
MRLLGFGDFNWEDFGFSVGIQEGAQMVPRVDPTILTRPGTYATFGISVIGELFIPGRVNFAGHATFATIEAAREYFWRRLNIRDTAPRQLRAVRLDATAIVIMAALQIPERSSNPEIVNEWDVNFVATLPYWVTAAPSTGSGAL